MIAVTSAGPNDGKSLTSVNLVLSMAREKSRDIVLWTGYAQSERVPRFGVRPPHDPRDYLERGGDVRELFFTVGSDNLLIAGNTGGRRCTSELLVSPRFEELLDLLRRAQSIRWCSSFASRLADG